MVKRRRRQLDLTALGQLAMQWDQLPENLQVNVQDMLFLGFAEVLALDQQFTQTGMTVIGQAMNPGEIEPHLQIAEVTLGEAAQGLAGTVAAGGAALVQLR